MSSYNVENYEQFLKSKGDAFLPAGIEVAPESINPLLFPFQRDIVRFGLRRGRALFGVDTGLGKTPMSLEWARLIASWSLIIAPLSVARQTVRMAASGVFGHYDVKYVRSQDEVGEPGIYITNYEMAHKFNPAFWGAVVLDESSILKTLGGHYQQTLTQDWACVPYRLCCTATPAPNDEEEIGMQAEFLGVKKHNEMLSEYFVHANRIQEDSVELADGRVANIRKKLGNAKGQEWRLRYYAKQHFYKWMATWAVVMTLPSDLDYDDDGFILPALNIEPIFVDVDYVPDGQLMFTGLQGVSDRAKVRKATMEDRVRVTADIVNNSNDQWICWCKLQSEADALAAAINDCREVRGSQSADEKADSLEAFQDGTYKVMITKAKIAGVGMNFQNAHNMAFVGMGDCYDEETEILSQNGWKHFCELKDDDIVATINPDTLKFEWQKPTRIIVENYSGKMIHFHGRRNFDLLVTPNHKLFVNRSKTRFPNDKSTWHLEYAQKIKDGFVRQEYTMLSCANGFDGTDIHIDIPIPSKMRMGERCKIVNTIDPETFMRLAGWFISEGYCRPIDSGEAGRISICQSEIHQENREEIISILKSLGLHVNAKTKDIVSYSYNLAAFLLDNFGGSSHGKKIPQWVKDMPEHLLVILRDTMIKGDGLHSNGAPRAYRTVSKQLADDFQEICIKTGVRASIKPRVNQKGRFGGNFYDVALAWENTNPCIWKEPQEIDYNGLIGCVTVPNHLVIVRRNGIPVISGNSWEEYYQCIRRMYRFGQTHPVNVKIILSEVEREIYDNVMRKERMNKEMKREMVIAMREYEKRELEISAPVVVSSYNEATITGDGWKAMLGDSCVRLAEIPDKSIDLSVYSPPFADLYTYSSSERDLGNSRNWDEFFEHYSYIIKGLLRVTRPGRNTCVHCADVPALQMKDGYMGLKDLPGAIVEAYEKAGWTFWGRAIIAKNPQAQAIRTKSKALAFGQLRRDSIANRPAVLDQILIFQNQQGGENIVPVLPVDNGEIDNEMWIDWAGGIWTDIRESDTLQFSTARDPDDEKHICPLQQGTIERCIKMWSNPGETVLTPFGGIGSEAYKAIQLGRKAILIELKESYFNVAVKNLRAASAARVRVDLFAYTGQSV